MGLCPSWLAGSQPDSPYGLAQPSTCCLGSQPVAAMKGPLPSCLLGWGTGRGCRPSVGAKPWLGDGLLLSLGRWQLDEA